MSGCWKRVKYFFMNYRWWDGISTGIWRNEYAYTFEDDLKECVLKIGRFGSEDL